MNAVLDLLLQHKSDRSFSHQPITGGDLDAIIEAGDRSPTSMNGQQVSVVVVQDAARRARIAELADDHAILANNRSVGWPAVDPQPGTQLPAGVLPRRQADRCKAGAAGR